MLGGVSAPSEMTPTHPRPQPGERVELEIESLAFGGAGVARHHGYVVFVAGALPGDRVRALLVKARRSHGEARLLEVLEAGPDRVEPAAEHPGAPWQILRYERQLEVKQLQVRDALVRLGRLEDFELEPIVPAVDRWRYRNKLEYSFGADANGELICGFHAPGEWERIVPVNDCLLASVAGNQLREQVLRWARAACLPAYDRRSGRGFLRNLVIREGRRTGHLQARLITASGELDRRSLAAALPHAAGVLWTRTDAPAEVAHGQTELLQGAAQLEERLCGLRVRISAEAFFQTNTEMAERLYRVALDYAGLSGFERVYDLFCGIGTIALVLAPRAAEVHGLELVEQAVADARANAALNEIDNVTFHAGDVRTALRQLLAHAGRPDVLVVDPPRAGLSQRVVRRIIECAPRRIVYVSCNPTTLAPNAAQLAEAGWRLIRVRAVDMFPQTPHIECVALLER